MARKGAWFISDRSGMRFPVSEAITEPGTGYRIHRSESDGRYNAVDHPQAHISDFVTFDDPKPIENARPDIDHTQDLILTDENGVSVTDSMLNPIYVY